jgi:processive 1,2-diacylglycerol beta-glucosyltransferase
MQTLFQELTQSLAGQHLLGFAYDAADRGRAKANMHRFIEMFVSLEMVRKLSKIRPDHVVCTHFLPAQVLGDLRSKRVNSVMRAQASALKLSLVLTDLDLQYMWVNDVDTYFVPREEAVYMLGAYGALEGGATASVSGIPIFPAFIPKSEEARSPDPRVVEASRLRELEALGKWKGVELGKGGWPKAADARPTVLFISSGNSVGEIYSRILACATPLRIIVGTGRQADVREMLTAMAVPSRHAVKMLGFVTDALDEKGRCDTPGGMPTLLRCTTIFIGKSGGLAIAEAAALKVPMIILDPIPGQEQRNADVLLEAGAAVKINDLPLITKRVDEALANGGAKAKSMAEAMGRIGRPNAAFTIVDAVLRGEVRSVHVGAHEHTE